MTKSIELTRRTALATFGASAAIAATPVLASVSSMTSAAGSTERVYLIWTNYHPMRPAMNSPHEGDVVELRIEEEYQQRPTLAAYSEDGLKLGYVATEKEQRLLANLRGGDRVTATVARKTENVVSKTYATGWAVPMIEVTVHPAALA